MVELPLLPDGVDRAGLDELAELPRRVRDLTPARRSGTTLDLSSDRPDRPALDVDASARRSGHPDRRVLRRPAASARPPPRPRSALRAAEAARPAHGGADHRPGPPAGPVDGPHRAGQHAAAGQGHRRRDTGGELHAMMLDMKRTFDEVVPGAHHAAAGRGDLRQPLLPGHELDLRRHAGVHGDGEAGPAAGHATSGT